MASVVEEWEGHLVEISSDPEIQQLRERYNMNTCMMKVLGSSMA